MIFRFSHIKMPRGFKPRGVLIITVCYFLIYSLYPSQNFAVSPFWNLN